MQDVKTAPAGSLPVDDTALRVESRRSAAFLGDVDRITDTPCVDCRRPLCGHEAVVSVLLGFRDSARCRSCIAGAMHEEEAALHSRVWHYVQRHECYMLGWRWANRREKLPEDTGTGCLGERRGLADARAATVGGAADNAAAGQGESVAPLANHAVSVGNADYGGTGDHARGRAEHVAATSPPRDTIATSEWNAGSMACGELVLELRRRLNTLQPGAVLRITALDAAAPEDIPAWCRLTRHVLIEAQHPTYTIKRKEE